MSTPARRAYGSDRVADGPDGLIYLSSRRDKGWTARRDKELTRAAFPGICVRWDEELFEVVSVEALPVGVRYALRRWDEACAIRVHEIYDQAAETRRAADHRGAIARRRKRWLWYSLALLAGHLPAPVQQRLQDEYGVSAATLTMISAGPLFLLGTASMIFLIASMLGAPLGIPLPLLMVGMYLFLESGVRFAPAFVEGRPTGSVVGALVYGLWTLLSRRR